MSGIEASVTRVIEGYKAAVEARDLEAFMRLYDPAIRVFDAWDVWSYEGAPTWRGFIESWFATRPEDRLVVTFDDVTSLTTPALASVGAMVTYAIVSARGEQLGAMLNRLTWVLKQSAGGLSIVHEHTSVPVNFEDQKAIRQHSGRT